MNYVAAGSRLANEKLDLRAGLFHRNCEKKNQNVGAPVSSRGTIDSFDPATITLDKCGKAKSLLKTRENIGLVKVTLDGAETEDHLMLPAIFKDKFLCTIYYTVIETGCTSGGPTIITANYPGGHATLTVNSTFATIVGMEGSGRLATAHLGFPYLGHDGSNYFLTPYPVGNHSNQLVPKVSCAAYSQQLISKSSGHSTVRTWNESIATHFGNDTFQVDDVGQAIGADHLDLYWGEDNPAGQTGQARFRPAGAGSYTGASDVFVQLLLIK